MHSLKEVGSNRTTILIAHRLSTIQDADRTLFAPTALFQYAILTTNLLHSSWGLTAEIVVMDKGRVAEIGTHDDLMALQGIYYTMWTQQQQTAAGNSKYNGDSHPDAPGGDNASGSLDGEESDEGNGLVQHGDRHETPTRSKGGRRS